MSTSAGWTLIVWGNVTGFCFAILSAMLSVISLPLLVDRNVGFAQALATSLTVVARNPGPVAVWGLVVVAALLLGALPCLIGLAVVFPMLGHATWHLYTRVVVQDPSPHPDYVLVSRGCRYAADFPASLFARTRDEDT